MITSSSSSFGYSHQASGVATADFPSPVVSINCILLYCHDYFNLYYCEIMLFCFSGILLWMIYCRMTVFLWFQMMEMTDALDQWKLQAEQQTDTVGKVSYSSVTMTTIIKRNTPIRFLG